jgi:hypothetical protein
MSKGKGYPVKDLAVSKLWLRGMGQVTHDYGAAAVEWALTAAEALGGYFEPSNASGSVTMTFPVVLPGKLFTVYNGTGQTLTIKVSGQSGQTLANGKNGVYVMGKADVVEVKEES